MTPPSLPANGLRDDERERCADCAELLDLRVELSPVNVPGWRLVLCTVCALVAIERDCAGEWTGV